MKKRKLVIEYDFDFDVYGIISSAKGYRLAWELNQYLGVHLVKEPDITVGFRKNVHIGFAHYSFETHASTLKLLRNKTADGGGRYYLAPEFPHFDFIVLSRFHDGDNILEQLRQVPSVELAAAVAKDELKSKSNFVF
ncbi:MAG TPA: IPExxxVDY family protein [Cyclobacteriaceae bacterium]|jgi:hypothetical protein